MFPHILIAAAVHNELTNLIDLVEKPVSSLIGDRKVISGYISDQPVRIIITGPALFNNVQSLTAAIENSRPSMIIQTGSAGAFRVAGLNIGDIGIATEEIDIHLGIEPETGSSFINELPFSLMVHEGHNIKNRYYLDKDLAKLAYNCLKKFLEDKNIGLKQAPFITVSTITATDRKAGALYREFKPCMENMEGSGAALLAIHYGIPCIEIRAASNFTGKRNIEAWDLPLASARVSLAVCKFIQSIKK
ncbi:MAG: futalosine hydrolase [Deltaproteobacteria bacterium]|nr:futalosine hydrolase [Deltaproteobacteria bacterium]